MSLKDEFKNLQSELSRISREKGQPLVLELVKDVFDKYSSVTKITWTQYTPWFNDGETCVFGMGKVTAILDDGESVSQYGSRDDGLGDSLDELADELSDYCDVLQTVFGDHVRVMVTRDGEFETEDYAHE